MTHLPRSALRPHAVPAGSGGVGRQQGDLPAARQPNHITGRCPEEGPAVASHLDRPEPGGQLRREVDLDGGTVGRRAVGHARQRLLMMHGEIAETDDRLKMQIEAAARQRIAKGRDTGFGIFEHRLQAVGQ